jgi:hypothetical protein
MAKGGGAAGDDEEELEEDDDDSGMQVDSEVVASIRKLPKADQRRLRAALRSNRGRRQEEGADDERGGPARDRERSPRPTKVNGSQEDP